LTSNSFKEYTSFLFQKMERNFGKSFESRDLEMLLEKDGYTILVENYMQGSSHVWSVPENYKVFHLTHANPDAPIATFLVIDPERTDIVRVPVRKDQANESEIRKTLNEAGYENVLTQYPSSNDMPQYHLIGLKRK
jgi:hypothetical protein